MASLKRSEFWAGVRAEIPLVVGVIPFGMIYGALALQSGIPPITAQAMSSIIFAGSSQFITAQLAGNGAPTLVIILTIAIVNLRHALYSASLAPYLRHLPLRWKAGLAYLLTDEAYGVTILHYDRYGSSNERHFFFLGAGLALWSGWQISTSVGILLGAIIPAAWSLDFALPLTFIALVLPTLKDRPALAAALAAGITAILANPMPFKLGILAAALVGIATGMLLEGRR